MLQPSNSALSFAEVGAVSLDSRRQSQDLEQEPLWPRGWRPWTCLVGCFFLMFNSWGIVNGYGTYLSYYKESLLVDYTIVHFNVIGATQCFFILFLSFIAGRLLDANYSRWLLVGGSILLALGMFTLSICNGSGYRGDGDSQIAATWFKRKKGFAIGVVASGASVFSSLIAITCIVSIFLAVPNPDHHFRRPSNWLATKTWIDKDAFKDPAFCWFTAAISWMFFGFYCVFFNLEEWSAEVGVGYKGLEPPVSGMHALRTYWLLAIMNGSSTIGRLSSSYLCDHFGALNVHAGVTLVSSFLCLFLWTFASNLGSALAFVIIFGAFSGAVIGLPPASMAAILGPHPTQQGKLGQWTGMMYTISSFFALTGPIISSHLVVKFDKYLTVQLWSGLCLFLSACCMCVAIIYHARDESFMRSRLLKLTPASTRSRSRSMSRKREMSEV
ncbi:hypothetical protein TWF106_000233 [Orbilia oligospora]|uniref:Major facilitator superfamily (MFS) profile domain-containing protein n=1 Tax=Orbilia oligospora TaxID=2813651 RepID=A0A7C8QUB0_ORBOL|nr:hypothetical protein TWF106_000233 [Orbilia oligospora]